MAEWIAEAWLLTIDPQRNSENKVYGGDGWTPTKAPVEYEVNYDAARRLEKTLDAASKKVAGGIFDASTVLRKRGIENTTEMGTREIAEKLAGDDSVRAAYLAEQGAEFEPVMMEKVYNRKYGNVALERFTEKVGEKRLQEIHDALTDGVPVDDALGSDADSIRSIIHDYYAKSQESLLARHAKKMGWTAEEVQQKGEERIARTMKTIAEGADGTSLGTLTLAGDENLNSIHRFSYGDNCWSRSAMRQYLNSDKPKGEWWTPQSRWDLAPDQLGSKDGYLCGIDPALLAAIKPVKVQTYRNTVCYDDKAKGNTPDITYDKVTLPSIEQMFITPQQAGEGEAQEYYVHLNGTGAKYAQWEAYPELRTYAVESRTAPQYVRLRSANRGYGYITWNVHSSGYVYTNYAVVAWRVAPLVFIG